MLLLWIILATVAGGLIAVSIAHWLAYRVFARYLHHMVSLSVGVLLSVALLHLLPEAFEAAQASAHTLFGLMLCLPELMRKTPGKRLLIRNGILGILMACSAASVILLGIRL